MHSSELTSQFYEVNLNLNNTGQNWRERKLLHNKKHQA